jgi:hypothetical protein
MHEHIWIEMLEDRNQASHTYEPVLANEIYQKIKVYYPILQKTYDALV